MTDSEKSRRSNPRCLAMTGVFDMANYGDLLFPLVAAAELAPYGVSIQPVAPTARTVPLTDALQPVALGQIEDLLPQIDGLLIGGGHILHCHPLDLITDYTNRPEATWAGPGLWLGAAAIAVQANVPVLFNGPGMPHPISTRWKPLVAKVAEASTYLNVRDTGSANLFQTASGVTPHIIPDPIADIARLWPKPDLVALNSAFRATHGIAADTGVLAIHIRDRSLNGTSAEKLAGQLDEQAKTLNLRPVLFALGRAHEDELTAANVARFMTTSPIVLDRPDSLRQVTAVLAHSSVYVGASLHGFVVAQAYGVPSLLVARPGYRKFSGYLEWIEEPEAAFPDWDSALNRLQRLPINVPGKGVPQRVTDALSDHWAKVAAVALSEVHPSPTTPQSALIQYLNTVGKERLSVESLITRLSQSDPILAKEA